MLLNWTTVAVFIDIAVFVIRMGNLKVDGLSSLRAVYTQGPVVIIGQAREVVFIRTTPKFV
jgi:hypothetical protein